MAFTIDPAAELLHALSKRLTATIVGLPSNKLLSPGRKVRVAKALAAIARALEKTAGTEIGLTKEGERKVDAGTQFTLVPKTTEWVIDEKACAQLFPRDKHPKAWRQSNKGGNVKTDVGPLVDA